MSRSAAYDAVLAHCRKHRGMVMRTSEGVLPEYWDYSGPLVVLDVNRTEPKPGSKRPASERRSTQVAFGDTWDAVALMLGIAFSEES